MSSNHPSPTTKSGNISYGLRKYKRAMSQGKYLIIIATKSSTRKTFVQNAASMLPEHTVNIDNKIVNAA
jgi:hypothetical protein